LFKQKRKNQASISYLAGILQAVSYGSVCYTVTHMLTHYLCRLKT